MVLLESPDHGLFITPISLQTGVQNLFATQPSARSFFAITDVGFVARSAREGDDGGEFRLAKIQRIIQECKYGVHDISAVTLDSKRNLPRFNMPLEFGLFLGCKRYGGKGHQSKISLIFDADPHRYQIFISDIAGQDIHSHTTTSKAQ